MIEIIYYIIKFIREFAYIIGLTGNEKKGDKRTIKMHVTVLYGIRRRIYRLDEEPPHKPHTEVSCLCR